MDVFGRGTDEPSRPLLSPAVCFICENSPSQDAHRVIDTRREFNPEALTRLSGRKYICEPCAAEMGGAMGMVPAAEYESAVKAYDRLNIEFETQRVALNTERESKVRVVAADEIADVVSATVRAELAKAKPVAAIKLSTSSGEMKPAAKKKPAAPKATGDKT